MSILTPTKLVLISSIVENEIKGHFLSEESGGVKQSGVISCRVYQEK